VTCRCKGKTSCSVLQCVGVLQCVAACYSVLQRVEACVVAVYVAVCDHSSVTYRCKCKTSCSVLQCVAVCCSVL